MGDFISKNKKWLGYIIFCIIIAGGLLYYRFPSDALKHYLQTTAHNMNHAVTLSIEQIKPSLPFGIKVGQTELFLKEKLSGKLLSADAIKINSSPWSFFQEIRKYCFSCFLYGGDATGCLSIKNSEKAPFINTEINLSNIRIAKHGQLKDLLGREIDGTLSGTVFYEGEHTNLFGGTGKAHLTLSDGKIALLVPILSITSIEFDEIKCNIILKKQTINFARFELTGPFLKSTVSGTISLRKEFTKSILDMEGTIEPFASFFKARGDTGNTVNLFKQKMKKGVLSFTISGTIDNPQVRLT